MASPIRWTMSISIILMLLAGTTLAQTNSPRNPRFIEIGWTQFDIGAEFDDSLVLSSSSEIVNVPEVLEASGLHVGFGRTFYDGGFSFFYLAANPETSSVLGDEDSHLKFFGMDFHYLPFAKKEYKRTVNPLIRGSVSLTSFSIEDSAFDGSRFADAGFLGVAGCLGLGVLVKLGDIGQLTGEIDRRWLSYATVKGTGKRIDLEDNLKASANFLKVALSIYL